MTTPTDAERAAVIARELSEIAKPSHGLRRAAAYVAQARANLQAAAAQNGVDTSDAMALRDATQAVLAALSAVQAHLALVEDQGR